jgi:hypothetical protein
MTVAPIVFKGARIDRTDLTGHDSIDSVMPSGASVGDRCIVNVCAFGFQSGYTPENSADPHITPPDSSWLGYYTQGKVDAFGAGASGYHDIWMYSWVKESLGVHDGFTFPDILSWEFNTDVDQSYTAIMSTQVFSGGQLAVDYANLYGVHGNQSGGWDSSAAGIATADGAALGAQWLYSYFGAFTRLTEPGTGITPTPTWTGTDGPNGGSNLSNSNLDAPTFGWYINSGSSAPTCRLMSEYHLTSVHPGVRLQYTESGSTSHGTFAMVPWLVVPGAAGGDIWGWGP